MTILADLDIETLRLQAGLDATDLTGMERELSVRHGDGLIRFNHDIVHFYRG